MSQTASPSPSEPEVKPRFRGVSHEVAFFISLVLGPLLVAIAPTDTTRLVTAIYVVSLAALFGCSALLHRGTWSDRVRPWMRRLDHSMIFVLIAATYTPFSLLVLHGALSSAILIVVWAGAFGGIVLNLVWVSAPKWLTATVYVALGWVAVAAMPALARELGAVGVGLIMFGGLLYTAGAVIYALGRPNPAPATFGYHEIFHVLVVAAAAAHFAVVAFYALPRG